ncbi:hypothetical protein Poli38472_008785 [Pythium oligandrum]|uniref:EamA domain-containing protein n=1 Tax=Pythium oligandrum TaxID=41045 RepID=A0A8K1C451_PYTOL|nr:hypothetical protein Poli38472_008785 [Pythium oligandrum]|eukprot:TMW56137.1 hypothetical protein Poli38472_008785 [Pythium oligandrum]
MSDRKGEALPLLLTTTLQGEDAADAQTSESVLRGLTYVGFSAVSFSVMATMVKFASYYISSMEAVFWRSAGALVLNYVCIVFNGLSVKLQTEKREMLFYLCLAGFLSVAFEFYAISHMVLADASVLIFSSPVIMFILGALFLREKVDQPSILCAALAFGGFVCVVRPGFLFGYEHATSEADGSWIAIISALVGTTAQALIYVAVRQLQGINALVIVHYFLLFSVVSSLLYIAVIEHTFVIPEATDLWVAVIGTGLFTFFGQMLLTKGLQLEMAGTAPIMRYLDVLCVFVWDSVFLCETINKWTVVGAVVICVCSSIITLRKAKVL